MSEETKTDAPEDDVHLPLLGHLDDLRNRLRYAVMAAMAGICVGYGFSDSIYNWLMAPVYSALPEKERYLVFTSLVEPFFVYMKIGAYAGIFIASPVILYQVWAFISPGLYRKERRLMIPFVGFGTVFFFGGGAFARYVVLPFSFEFLVQSFSFQGLRPMLTMDEQLSLVLVLLLAFAVIFEMPLILTLLAQIGIVTSDGLTKARRVALVVNLVAAAIITPTGDPFNLMLMAVPMILCYELGIIGAKLVEKRKATDLAAEQAAAAGTGAVAK